MNKQLLKERVEQAKTDTGSALQTLNKGQRKQLVKRQEIKELFDRYGVDYTNL